jgi:hypothetical protein
MYYKSNEHFFLIAFFIGKAIKQNIILYLAQHMTPVRSRKILFV